MTTKTYLSLTDLLAMFDSIWSYNRRGQVSNLLFFDAAGKQLDVSWVGVMSEETGLLVRSRPEEDPVNQVRPALDPRVVPQPMNLDELQNELNRAN